MDDALTQMGVLNSLPEANSVTKFEKFEKDFKATWANHADAVSVVYSGSGALNTDYTRTGTRTKPGMVQDGVRSALRYIYQNFLDGRRQDGIDLFLGVVSIPKPDDSAASVIEGGTSLLAKVLPLVFFLLMC